MMPAEPSRLSPPRQQQNRRSSRFSQTLLRNLRSLRPGAGAGEQQQSEQGSFQITHTPDRPARLVSPLEAPTEEECFDEIRGWHYSAAAERRRTTAELAGPEENPGLSPRQELQGTDNRGPEHEPPYNSRSNCGDILQPRTYVPRAGDSFVTNTYTDNDDDGNQHHTNNSNLSDDWGTRSPEEEEPISREVHERFKNLLNYNPASASAAAASSQERSRRRQPPQRQQPQRPPTPKTPDTPTEQGQLELDTPLPTTAPPTAPEEEEQLSSEEQMQRLWAHVRGNKDVNSVSGISRDSSRNNNNALSLSECFTVSSGDDDTDSIKIHETRLVDVERPQVVDVDGLKRAAIIQRGMCPYCLKRMANPKAAFCAFCRANLRDYSKGGFQAPQTVENGGVKREKEGGGGRGERPERSEMRDPEAARSPPKLLRERAFLDQSRYDESLESMGYYDQSNDWRAMLPGNIAAETYGDLLSMSSSSSSNTRPMPFVTAKKDKGKAVDVGTRTGGLSSLPKASWSSPSSSKSSASRTQPPKPPAQRASLGQQPSASSSSVQPQLRHRPAHPLPEKTWYADKNKKKAPTKQQQPRPQNRDAGKKATSASVNKPHANSPSPLRHEIKGEQPARKQTPSGPLLPPTIYQPSPATPVAGSSKVTAPTPKSPPQRPKHPSGYAIPPLSVVSSTSRPNQAQPLNRKLLCLVAHQPNHPSPLLRDTFTPWRASPPIPALRPSMIPSPSVAPVAAQPRQASTTFLEPTRYEPLVLQRKRSPSPLSEAEPATATAKSATKTAQVMPKTPSRPPPPLQPDVYTPSTAPVAATTSTTIFDTSSSTSTRARPATPNAAYTSAYTTPVTAKHPAFFTSVSLPISPFSHSAFPSLSSSLPRLKRKPPPPANANDAQPMLSRGPRDVPMFRFESSEMTPGQRSDYERAIVENGDNADLYMDIYGEYTDDEDGKEITSTEKERRRTMMARGEMEDGGEG